MQRGTHLTVDRFCERVPSAARLGEPRVVHVGQKISTRDVEPILHCSRDAIQNRMNQIHSDVCYQADKQEKEADELIEAHLGRIKSSQAEIWRLERVKRIGLNQ